MLTRISSGKLLLSCRYDWYSGTGVAVLRMPLDLHEIPLNFWLQDVLPILRGQLQKAAICDRWDPRNGGSPTCNTADGSGLEPDLSLWITRPNAPVMHLGELPRVVIEVAFSQTFDSAKDKAWRWLHSGKLDVHAVVVCKLSYPVTEKRDFRAEIGVWVRGQTDTGL